MSESHGADLLPLRDVVLVVCSLVLRPRHDTYSLLVVCLIKEFVEGMRTLARDYVYHVITSIGAESK
jgi:hypothetical protein